MAERAALSSVQTRSVAPGLALWGPVQNGAIRGGGALIELLFVLLAGRALGLAETGAFLVAYTLFMVAVAFGRGGLDFMLVREIARARQEARHDHIPGLALTALAVSGLLSLALMAAIQAATHLPTVTDFLGGGGAQVLRILSFALLPVTVIYLIAEICKGFEYVRISQLIYGCCLLLPSLFYLILSPPDRATELASFLLRSAAVVAAILLAAAAMHIRPLLRPGVPLWVVPRLGSLFWVRPLTLLGNWSPIWILNALGSVEAAGAYAVANRLAAAISLAAIAVDASSAPAFSRGRVAASYAQQRRTLRRAQMVSGGLSLGLGAALVACGRWLLALMGGEFVASALAILWVLAAAHVVNGGLAPLGTFALMTGRERLALRAYAVTLAVTIALLLASARSLGGLGAAVVLVFAFGLRGGMLEYGLNHAGAPTQPHP